MMIILFLFLGVAKMSSTTTKTFNVFNMCIHTRHFIYSAQLVVDELYLGRTKSFFETLTVEENLTWKPDFSP